MSPASVSVVIPVRDGERFLAEAIRSALAQSRPPAEILVIDDGSADRSSDIAASFGRPVRLLRQGRLGPAAARNAGLRAAGGDVIALLDADDLMTPDRLEVQTRRLAAEESPTVVFGGQYTFCDGERPLEALRAGEVTPGRVTPAVVPSAMLCRREVFDRVGPFDESLMIGDSVAWIARATALGVRRVWVPEVVLCRRAHEHNLSRGRAGYCLLVKAHLDARRAGVAT